MACRAENDKIIGDIVVTLAVEVSDLQNLDDAEATMSTINAVVVMLQGELPIVDALHTRGPRTGLTGIRPNAGCAWPAQIRSGSCRHGHD
jgi:hypothetical protein